MEFKTFITEGKSDTVVYSHGRMNPPTSGHKKLVDIGQKLAKKLGADHEISITHSHDPKKNPLSPEQKLKHARRAFPKLKISQTSKELPSFLHQAKRLYDAGHRHLVMVAGSDRADEYRETLNKYNGHPDFYNFKSIWVPDKKELQKHVGMSLERDPDSEGAEGMSATKMRQHASDNDFTEFRKGVPAHFSDAQAREMFNDVRQGQVRESVDLRRRYINGEIYNIGDRVVTEHSRGEIVYRGSTYVTLQLEDHTTEKYWVADLEERSGQYYTKSGLARKNPTNPSGLSKKYSGELSHATQLARKRHFDKNAEKSSSDSSAYKPAPGDAFSQTKVSQYTKRYHERYGLKERKIPAILLTKEQALMLREEELTYAGYTTSNLDLCPGATITLKKLMAMPDRNPEYVLKAIQATDLMLGVEREALNAKLATPQMIHDFTMYMGIAHDTLHLLGMTDADFETKYGKNWFQTHMNTMHELSNEHIESQYGTLLPRNPEAGEVEESMNYKSHQVQDIVVHDGTGKSKKRQHLVKKLNLNNEEASALAKKAAESGVSVDTLRKVYKRGIAAWRTGHRPGTTPQQWGMARVNSYITKGKTYHTADKDLREAEEVTAAKQSIKTDDSVFHGVEMSIPDQVVDNKPVGMVRFGDYMKKHLQTAQDQHRADTQGVIQHGPGYRAMAKHKQLEP
jgi:hypothetical protein